MQVSTIEQLRVALSSKPTSIEITDEGLARKVKLIKSATGPALAAVLAAGGIGATMWWNPIGWAASAVAITTEGALLTAVTFFVASMGVALLWALFNSWDIDASAEAQLDKPGVKVSLKLRPKN